MLHHQAITVQYTKFHTIPVKQFRTEWLCNGLSALTVHPNKPLYLKLAALPRLFLAVTLQLQRHHALAGSVARMRFVLNVRALQLNSGIP